MERYRDRGREEDEVGMGNGWNVHVGENGYG